MTQIILRLNYQTFFDGKETLIELLKPLDKDELLRAVSYLVNRSKTEKKAIITINNWFSDNDVKSELISRTPSNGSILNVFSSLKLLNYIFERDENTTEAIDKNEFELRLFKAYLLLNSEQDTTEESGQKKLPTDHDERIIASLLTLSYHDYDIQNYILHEVFLSQLIKSIEYFQFIEQHSILKHHLNLFLDKYKCSDWQEWIYKLLNIIIPVLGHNNDTYSEIRLKADDSFETNTLFLSLFSVPIEYTELPDFTTIRSSPLQKVNDHTFLVINKLFLIERIFKSVIFEFSLKINKEVSEEFRIRDFRSIYCDFFSEQVLLYQTIWKCFPSNSKYQKFKGEDFKSQGYSSEPDFYIRFKNKILLFESKDVILIGEEKISRDYSILSKGLKDKFLKVEKDGKTSKKAILQIIENIKRVFNEYYKKIDVSYNTDYVKVYPVLVTHDRQFDTPELNRLLNKWFREELDSTFDTNQKKQIKNLTIINIDTLIIYQEHFFKRGEYGLETLIDKYQAFAKPTFTTNYEKNIENYMNTSISFSAFVGNIFDKTNFKETPSFIEAYIKKLNIPTVE
jgi:hypothetical protein